MFSGRLTHATVRILDWIAGRTLPPDNLAEHLRTDGEVKKMPISISEDTDTQWSRATFDRPTAAAKLT
jgi:hypothetical protein